MRKKEKKSSKRASENSSIISQDLESAISSGNREVVESILQSRSLSMNHADLQGYTPLIKAACSGNTDIVRIILTSPQTNVNQQDNNGYSGNNAFTNINNNHN